MPTTSYATDADVLEHDGNAAELPLAVDAGTFDRHRSVVYRVINAALARRSPPACGVAGDDQFVHVECLGVLAMGYRENCAVAGERDRYWSLAQDYQNRFETELENVRAPADEEDPDLAADESPGNSIPFDRC
jgi:hypothetical protein